MTSHTDSQYTRQTVAGGRTGYSAIKQTAATADKQVESWARSC